MEDFDATSACHWSLDIDGTDNVRQNIFGVEVTVNRLVVLTWNLSKRVL